MKRNWGHLYWGHWMVLYKVILHLILDIAISGKSLSTRGTKLEFFSFLAHFNGWLVYKNNILVPFWTFTFTQRYNSSWMWYINFSIKSFFSELQMFPKYVLVICMCFSIFWHYLWFMIVKFEWKVPQLRLPLWLLN